MHTCPQEAALIQTAAQLISVLEGPHAWGQDTGREGFPEGGREGQGSPEEAAWLRARLRSHQGSRAAAETLPRAERPSSETCGGPDPRTCGKGSSP